MTSDRELILIDVDNTLLDNGRVVDDLKGKLVEAVGADGERRYWELFEELWKELEYADYLGAVQRLRLERPGDSRVSDVALFLLDYPFADRVYRGA